MNHELTVAVTLIMVVATVLSMSPSSGITFRSNSFHQLHITVTDSEASDAMEVPAPLTPRQHSSESILALTGITTTSGNWGGYVYCVAGVSYDSNGYYCQNSTSASGVTEIIGEWTVPTVVSTNGGSSTEHSSTWVGIGGDDCAGCSSSLGDLVQAGTEENTGSTSATAWWEMLPAGENAVTLSPTATISPGDTIYVAISYGGTNIYGQQQFAFYIDDTTTSSSWSGGEVCGWPYSSPCNPSTFSSADFIEEATTYNGAISQMPAFSATEFWNAQIFIGGSSSGQYLSSTLANLLGIYQTSPPSYAYDTVVPTPLISGAPGSFWVTYLVSIYECSSTSFSPCPSLSQNSADYRQMIYGYLLVYSPISFTSSQATNLGFGMSLMPPSTPECNWPSGDVVGMSFSSGTNNLSHSFQVCSNGTGTYQVINGIWYVPAGGSIAGPGSLDIMNTGWWSGLAVSSDPSMGVPTASPGSGGIDAYQTVTFTGATASGGRSPYSYAWTSLPTGCTNSGGLTDSCTPTASGTFTVTEQATDSNGYKVTSSISYLVYPDPSVNGPIPSQPSADVGQTVTFSVTVTNPGSGGDTYSWSMSSTLGCSGSTGTSITCTLTSQGNWGYTFKITDSNGRSELVINNYIVDFDPTVGTPSANPSSVDIGQSVTFTSATPTGGSGGYTYSWNNLPSGCSNSLASTASCSPTGSGTFSVYVTVKDSNGYPVNSPILSYTVDTDPTVGSPTASPGSGGIDKGQMVTFTSAAPSGGSGGYTYSWISLPTGCTDSGASTDRCTPTASGTFTVTVQVKDSNGYPVTGSITYQVLSDPYAGIPIANRTSVDLGQSVTIATVAGGGTGTYTYTWTQSSVNFGCSLVNSLSIVCTPTVAGNYTVSVSVKDGNGYTSATNTSALYPVYADPVANAPIITPFATIDLTQTGILSASVTGGSGGFTYSWSGMPGGCPTSGSPVSCTPTGTGVWTVSYTVTDSNGKKSTSTAVTFTVNTDPTATFTPSTSQTNETGQINNFTATANGGTTPYSYQWLVNGTAVAGATGATFAFHPLHPATYLINVSVTDSAIWVVWTVAVTETVTPGPLTSLTQSARVIDVGMTVTFNGTVSGGIGPYTWTYYLNGAQVQSGVLTDWNFTASKNGTYIVTLTVTDSKNAHSSQSLSVIVNARPSGAVTPATPALDLGQKVTLSLSVNGGTAPLTYQWYLNGSAIPGATSTSYTFTPGGVAKYLFNASVTDALGVVGWSNLATLTVNPDPALSISAPRTAIDAGQSLNIAASPLGGTYPLTCSWLVNGTVVPGATSCSLFVFTPSGPGSSWTVQAKLTDNASMSAQSSVLTIIVNPRMIVGATGGPAQGDVGQNFSFTGTVSGGTPAYSCQWFVNGAPSSGATSCSTFTLRATAGGTMSVELRVTDTVSNTVNSTVVSITVNPDPTVSLAPQGTVWLSAGQQLTINSTVTGGTLPIGTYVWTLDGTVQSSSGTSFVFSSNSVGNHTLALKITDSAGFSSTSSTLNIEVVVVSVSVTGPTQAEVSIAITLSAKVTGGTAPYTYRWYVNGQMQSGTTGATLSWTPTSVGAVNVSLQVVDVHKISGSGSTTLNVLAAVAISVNTIATSGDVGASFTLTSVATGGLSPYTYQWSLNGSSVSGATGSSYVFHPLGSGTYSFVVSVSDALGGHATSSSVNITVTAAPSVSLSASQTQITVGGHATLTATVAGGTHPLAIVWLLNGTVIAGVSGDSYIFNATGSDHYAFKVEVTDAKGVSVTSNVVTVNVTTVPTTGSSNSATSSLYTWIIVGIVVGAAVLIGLFLYRKRRNQKESKTPTSPTTGGGPAATSDRT